MHADRKLGLGAILLLTMASCGSGAAAPSSAVSTNASAKVQSPAASAPSASAKTPIRIGVLEPLTGSNANSGKDNEDGFNLYLASINNTVAGRHIEVSYGDDQFKADVGLTKARELVENDKVQILAGVAATPECYAVAEYAKQAAVPFAVSGNCGAIDLTLDPKYQSPYLVRLTQAGTTVVDPAADWAYKQGFRKAVLIASDFGGGLQAADGMASAFIRRGGTIVQELYPPLGTADFGTYVAQLNPNADVILAFITGVDGLRFLQQYSGYAGRRVQVVDAYGAITRGPNLAQLKDKAVGVVASAIYSEAFDSPANQTFIKAFHGKYPGRLMSSDVAQGYAGAQVLVAALKKVNGDIENKQQFLDALDATDVETIKGPIKLDNYHDVVQNMYLYKIVKQGNSYGQQLVQTYNNVSQTWDRTIDELLHFPFGKMKGKWVGMSQSQLAALNKG